MENQHLPRKTVFGIITDKKVNEKKGPKGFFFIGKEKYTCWSQTVFDKFEIDDEVEIIYTEAPNEYNGKTYINKTISVMNYKDRGVSQFYEEEKEAVQEVNPKATFPKTKNLIKSENGVVKLGGLYYKIKNIELELLPNEQPEYDGETRV